MKLEKPGGISTGSAVAGTPVAADGASSTRTSQHIVVTNATTPGTPGSPTQINTGDPQTKGLLVKGHYITERPDNSMAYASFTSGLDFDWSNTGGTLTGTALAGAGVVSGELDLTGSVVDRGVSYSATNNANFGPIGTIRFKLRPNYTGSPSSNQVFVWVGNSGGFQGSIQVHHWTSGNIVVYVGNDSGSWILAGVALGVWSPTAGSTYIHEFNIDSVNSGGAYRYFIDRVQFGSTQTGTGTRTTAWSDRVYVGQGTGGAGSSPNFKLDDLVFFSTVQHTANHESELPYNYTTNTQSVALIETQDYDGNTLTQVKGNGELSLSKLGRGLSIKEGTNGRMGTGILSSGTVTISNTSVTASSRIFIQPTASSASAGHLHVTISAGSSFTVTSSNASDGRTFNWVIFEPA